MQNQLIDHSDHPAGLGQNESAKACKTKYLITQITRLPDWDRARAQKYVKPEGFSSRYKRCSVLSVDQMV